MPQHYRNNVMKPKKHRVTLGLYSPPTPGDDKTKLPGILDGKRETAAQRPLTENSAGLGSFDQREVMKRTKKPQTGML